MEPAELLRCRQRDAGEAPWDRWGTYLSDRQWGTVREDYSTDGNAWASFPFDHSHLRTYRWGEDGLLGLSDEQGLLCLAPVLWNGRDPILKERLFGLGNPEGNHGEDIKEAMYHLAGTPTGSYAKALYRYPQQTFPYDQLREENKRRGRDQPEFELVDTGIFNQQRFFDLEVEIAKATPEDILIRFTVTNRGPEAADLHLLPSLWFRNTWGWADDQAPRGVIEPSGDGVKTSALPGLAAMELHCSETGTWLYTENESNALALYGQPLSQPISALLKPGATKYRPLGNGSPSPPPWRQCYSDKQRCETAAKGPDHPSPDGGKPPARDYYSWHFIPCFSS